MKCAYHPDIESNVYCSQCGRPLGPECRRDVQGLTYCEPCLGARLRGAPFSADLGANPGLALFLGFIPGVGAVYNGQILKAIVQVLIFGSLVALSHQTEAGFGVVFGLGAAAFYFYMVIDSYQVARRKQLGQPVEEGLSSHSLRMDAPLSAIVLIALGILFLLDNIGIHIFANVGRFWPVLLIIIGVVLIQRKVAARPLEKQGPPPKTPGSGPESM